MIPRKRSCVFSVSNLRCSHGFFSTLQPAECCKMKGESWTRCQGWGCQQAKTGNLDSVKEKKKREKIDREGGWQQWGLPKREEHMLTASVGRKPLLHDEYEYFFLMGTFIIISIIIDVTFNKEKCCKVTHCFKEHQLHWKRNFSQHEWQHMRRGYKSRLMKYPHSHVSILTSMTRKTEFGVSWKRRNTESVTGAIYPEAAVSATTQP